MLGSMEEGEKYDSFGIASIAMPQATTLHSQPFVSEQYQTAVVFQPEVISKESANRTSIGKVVTQTAISEQVTQRSLLLSSVSESNSESIQSLATSAVASSFVTSSFTSSITSFVTSYVTSSVSSVTSHASQAICEPVTSLVSSISYPAVSSYPSSTISLSQTEDKIHKQKGAISINFVEDVYANFATGEVHSIVESIKMDLLDFKIESGGQEILLSECVQQDDLIRLPHTEQALTFSELVQSGLVTTQNCTLLDKVAHREVPLKSTLPREAFTSGPSATEDHLHRAQSNEPSISLLRPSVLSANEPIFPSVLTISSEEVVHEVVHEREHAKLSTTEVRLLPYAIVCVCLVGLYWVVFCPCPY